MTTTFFEGFDSYGEKKHMHSGSLIYDGSPAIVLSASYPMMSIAKAYALPYEVVLLVAETMLHSGAVDRAYWHHWSLTKLTAWAGNLPEAEAPDRGKKVTEVINLIASNLRVNT